jgi:beta-mannosidase
MLMTVGPWKPIGLHTYNTKIVDIDVRSKVSERLDVDLTVDFSLSTLTSGLASVTLRDSLGVQVAEENNMKATLEPLRAEFAFSAGFLDLWYPVGYGKQPLYTVEVKLADEVHTMQHPWCFQLNSFYFVPRSMERS